MSHQAVTWAMDYAPMLLTDKGRPDTTARHVLQVLAEHAHEDGSNAHPSLVRIQYRTGYERTTVQRALRRLETGKLIAQDGTVEGRARWNLAMKLRRSEYDWSELMAREEQHRAGAAARVRRHRAKQVTDSAPVTPVDVTDSAPVTRLPVTHPDAVTNPGVTDSAPVTDTPVTHSHPVTDPGGNALEERYVTDSASVCNGRRSALTVNEPPQEPSLPPVPTDAPTGDTPPPHGEGGTDTPAAGRVATAAAFLEHLPAPWTLGRQAAAALAPLLLKHADDTGWAPGPALVAKLTENPGGINDYRAVLTARIRDLPRCLTPTTGQAADRRCATCDKPHPNLTDTGLCPPCVRARPGARLMPADFRQRIRKTAPAAPSESEAS